MYEPHHAHLLTKRQFVTRMLGHLTVVLGLLALSLIGGMVGYVSFARMSWIDAFLNSSMLLGGMGEIGDLPNDASKLFAGVYALYAGLVFIASSSILAAPIIHRIAHHLHIERGRSQEP